MFFLIRTFLNTFELKVKILLSTKREIKIIRILYQKSTQMNTSRY